MDFETMMDWDEAFEYAPGTVVELKSRPGNLRAIAHYELTMVPPIWLVNDPRPHYPHELRIISRQTTQVCALVSQPALA